MNCAQGGNGPMMRGGGPMMRGGGGWSSGPYARVYDPKSVETLKGEVGWSRSITSRR